MFNSVNAGQKGTGSSSPDTNALSAINSFDNRALVVIDPLILCAVIIAALARPQSMDELTGTLYTMLRHSFCNSLVKYESLYKEYFLVKFGHHTKYDDFDKGALVNFIVKSVLPKAMTLSVDEFRNALSKYWDSIPADLLDEGDAIISYYESSIRNGEVFFRPLGCDSVIRLLSSKPIASALLTAYTQLSVFLTESVSELIYLFNKERLGKNTNGRQIAAAIEYAGQAFKGVEKVMSESIAHAFSALELRSSNDISASQVFRTYFHAYKTDAIRGLLSLSVALFSTEYRLTRKSRSKRVDKTVGLSIRDALTGRFNNDAYIEEILNGMNPTGQMLLDYCEHILAVRFDICIPISEYIGFRQRLCTEGTLNAKVTSVITTYRNTQKFKKGEKVSDFKGFIEAMNTRFRKRLYTIIAKPGNN